MIKKKKNSSQKIQCNRSSGSNFLDENLKKSSTMIHYAGKPSIFNIRNTLKKLHYYENDPLSLKQPAKSPKKFSLKKRDTLPIDNLENFNSGEISPEMPFLFGVSVTGQSHIESNIPCQDNCHYAILSPNIAAIAVSDGVGSEKNSEIGSNIAVHASIDYLSKNIIDNTQFLKTPQKILLNSMEYAREKIQQTADEMQQNISTFACTLITIVWCDGMLFSAHIGDGGIIAVKDDDYVTISAPDILEYSNLVYPLTNIDWRACVKYSENKAYFRYCAAFTDGCQNFIFIREKDKFHPFPAFLSPLFEFADSTCDENLGIELLTQLLKGDRLKQYSHDDKTLIVCRFPWN